MRAVTWPDTRHEQPPGDHLYRSATWLLGRHPHVAQLAERVPGIVTVDSDGPDIDLDALAEAFREREELNRAWEQYRRSHPEPEDEAAADRWEAAGPPLGSPATRALGVLSRTEVARLRLLAVFSSYTRTPFSVSDLYGFDEQGQAYIADWCRAVQAA